MRSIAGRVKKLEDRLGITAAPGLRIVLTDRGFEPGEEEAYLKVLEEAGLLSPNRFAVVDLTHVPPGMSVEEMQTFVREKHRVPVPKAPPSPEFKIVLERYSGRPGL